MKRVFFLLGLLGLAVSLSAHPWKPRHYVIIDTDGGIDDQKAICMLLASPDVRVLAITASGGFLEAKDAEKKIRLMLDEFRHEGLPLASGDEAVDLIIKTLSEETTPVTFIELASLETVAKTMEKSDLFSGKIRQILWSNGGLPGEDDFNYRTAPEAARKVLSGPIPVSVAGSGGTGFYDPYFMSALAKINTRYAKKVTSIINDASSHAFAFSAFDEMIPLLLHYPSLFKPTTSDQKNSYFLPGDITFLHDATIRILSGQTVQKMQAIKSFPSDTSFYMKDLQPFVTEIQNKYGEDEWTSGVIASELHRHLGVFAIIGVKMGIRAREYFCTGVDEMSVLSYAGSTPPLSCMNDGLQVSTGATPGHGLLDVKRQEPFAASAEFTYRGRTIRITLKKEIAAKMLSELKDINFVYGLDSDIYWEMVRKNTIKYWLLFDRNEIFDIEPIK